MSIHHVIHTIQNKRQHLLGEWELKRNSQQNLLCNKNSIFCLHSSYQVVQLFMLFFSKQPHFFSWNSARSSIHDNQNPSPFGMDPADPQPKQFSYCFQIVSLIQLLFSFPDWRLSGLQHILVVSPQCQNQSPLPQFVEKESLSFINKQLLTYHHDQGSGVGTVGNTNGIPVH